MYVFERAAELKAKSERYMKVAGVVSVRTVINVSISAYQIIQSLVIASLAEPKHGRRVIRKNARGRRAVEYQDEDLQPPTPPPEPKRAETVEELEAKNLELARQLEEFKRFQAMLAAQQHLLASAGLLVPDASSAQSTTTSTTAPSSSSSPAPAATPTGKIATRGPNVPEPPLLDGWSWVDGVLTYTPPSPVVTHSVVIPAKPRAQPRPVQQSSSSGFMIRPEDLRRPLRSIKDPNNVPGAPSASTDGTSSPIAIPIPASVLKPASPALVSGRRVEARRIPGEEGMSFAERIRVASKIGLRKTDAILRSPGGTPLTKHKPQEAPFQVALKAKFKNFNRDSFGPNDKDDDEW